MKLKENKILDKKPIEEVRKMDRIQGNKIGIEESDVEMAC